MNHQEEQNLTLKYILNNSIFNHFTKAEEHQMADLELIITPECNLDCSYCYFNKHKDELYPKDIRDPNQIMKNLNILLDFIIEKDLFIETLTLFSGEIWGSNFGLKVLQALLEKNNKKIFCKNIIIPSNMSFLLNDEKANNIEQLMADFKEKGINVAWSASIDGKIIEDKFRPFNEQNQKHTDDFYDKVFCFIRKHPSTGLHPMISSKSCKYWIENYQWFESQLKPYCDIDHISKQLMMLEVRNPDWTDEDIGFLKEFLHFLILDQKNKSNSQQEFAQRIFKYGDFKASLYSPYSLKVADPKLSCSLPRSLAIRLGDLAIVPCHRLAYKNLIIGHFLVNDNDEIYDVDSKNVDLYLHLKTMNPKINMLKCERCKYNTLCIKGCPGVQYEQYQHLNYPCDNICKLFQEKIDFLIDIYYQEGLIEQLEADCEDFPTLKSLLIAIKGIKQDG